MGVVALTSWIFPRLNISKLKNPACPGKLWAPINDNFCTSFLFRKYSFLLHRRLPNRLRCYTAGCFRIIIHLRVLTCAWIVKWCGWDCHGSVWSHFVDDCSREVIPRSFKAGIRLLMPSKTVAHRQTGKIISNGLVTFQFFVLHDRWWQTHRCISADALPRNKRILVSIVPI